MRRVFVYNPEKAGDDRAFRNQQIERTEQRLIELNAMAMKATLERQEEITRKVALALARHKTTRWFKATVIPQGKGTRKQLVLVWHRRQDVIEKDACHDGIFVIVASLIRRNLGAPEMVRTYKNLIRVEGAFLHLISQIDMRPVFVRKKQHIEGHALGAFIAYYLRRSIEVSLEQAGEPLSAEKTLRELARIKAVENRAGTITFSEPHAQARPLNGSSRSSMFRCLLEC